MLDQLARLGLKSVYKLCTIWKLIQVNECNSSTACAVVPGVTLSCGQVGRKSCNNKM